jgi:hypothetical protein
MNSGTCCFVDSERRACFKVQSPVAQLLPLHEPEKEFKDCFAGASI